MSDFIFVSVLNSSAKFHYFLQRLLFRFLAFFLFQYELALLADFHQIFNKIYSDPVIVRALDAFDPVMHSFQSPPRQQVKPCLDSQISPLAGYIIAKELRKLKMSGFSGNIEFDSNGLRKNFKLDIVQANAASTKTPNVVVGSWDDSNG